MVLAQFLFNDADGVYVRILRKLLKMLALNPALWYNKYCYFVLFERGDQDEVGNSSEIRKDRHQMRMRQ